MGCYAIPSLLVQCSLIATADHFIIGLVANTYDGTVITIDFFFLLPRTNVSIGTLAEYLSLSQLHRSHYSPLMFIIVGPLMLHGM